MAAVNMFITVLVVLGMIYGMYANIAALLGGFCGLGAEC